MAGEIQLNSVTLATESGGVITLDSGIDIKGNLNATGSAPVYACRAWVNFSATGSTSVSGSGNVSSVTDNGTGDFNVNFTTSMSDTNYIIVSGGTDDNHSAGWHLYERNKYVGTAHVKGMAVGGGSTPYDSGVCHIAIFR